MNFDRREVLVRDAPAAIGGRAYDIFEMLVRSAGALVSKHDIMERVWAGVVVGDNVLEVHVSAIRKALGADRGLVKTAYGRGYRVVGSWQPRRQGPARASSDAALGGVSPQAAATNLPTPTSGLIGRDVAVADIMSLLGENRFVTLVGTGGIGKTRLALEVARHLLPHYDDGAWLVEFGALSASDQVPGAVAAVLGLDIAGKTMPLEAIRRSLRSKRLLLLLDNCEHLVEACARLAETVLRAGAGVRVLATSREALRAEGEHRYPVPPLSIPTPETPVQEMVGHSAVQLFLARAAAAEPGFPTDERSIGLSGLLCRRMDGIPLAIELAAARAVTLGMEVLVARLDDRLRLLGGGRRTALPRHQTLRATLDWSFGLLSQKEQAVLRRLSVFAGHFDIDASTAVAAGDDVQADEVVECVAQLVAKSLLVSEADGAAHRYHLLDTTRLYLIEKLGTGSERETTLRLHARYHRDLFEQAEAEWGSRPLSEWMAAYAPRIDDVSAALDWAFSPAGDASLGAELAVLSAPLWFQLSLVEAGIARFGRALALVDEEPTDGRARMQLNAGLGWLGMFEGGSVPRREAAWSTALELAQRLGDIDYELRALWALYGVRLSNGEFRRISPLVESFGSAAAKSSDPFDLACAERLAAYMLHIGGQQAEARSKLEHLLEQPECRVGAPRIARFQFDHRVLTRMTHARVMWLQGFADDALIEIENSVSEAAAINHLPSLCTMLCDAALPVTFLAGDFAATRRHAAMLRQHTAVDRMMIWHGYVECYEGAVAIRSGDGAAGMRTLRAGVDQRRLPGMRWQLAFLLGVLADGLAASGLAEEALTVIDEAVTRAEQTGTDWCRPELLRIKGEVLAMQVPAHPGAGECFQQALALAQMQGALAWELRAALGLARWLQAKGQAARALAMLAPVYQCFTQGFATADLKQASTLLVALHA